MSFGGGVLIGVSLPPGGGSAPAIALRVDSELPAWLAPGATLTVSGRASPEAPVALRVGGRRVVVGRSGPLGRFVVTGVVPGAGRHGVEISSAGRRFHVGRLLVRPIRVAAVGDVTPGGGVAERIAAHGVAYPWASVAPVLRRADLATANLEGVISSRGAPVPGKEYTFRGGPGLLVGAARVAGLDVLSVANNHSLDFGREAFLDTLGTARRLGLRAVGGGATLEAARQPALVQVGGLRVAVLGYSDVRPLGFDAGPDWAGTARADGAAIAEDVRAARRRAELVIVWFHWGVELAAQPNARQRSLAAAATGAGAALVLGAHPHRLQPLERRGRTLVAWSLGNFVFASHRPETRRTGILVVDLDARGVAAARLRPASIEGVRPVLDGR
jgi:poly-gamma-glutamate synthesis protein (capsule biosynthesis protein)